MLLRHAPPRAWAYYVVGSGPFVLGAVWFWSALCNRSPAQAQALAWALPLAVLHLWMRVWQSRFSALLFDLRCRRAPTPWTVSAWARAATNQLLFGVPTFIALFPALVIALPFGWVYAYYHTLAVTAHRPAAASLAWKAARHSPYQNHSVLAWFVLCVAIAFLNVFTVVWIAPGLIKLFVPVEWAFTRYPFWILNSTALFVITALTYLTTDPLVKALYVLRTFYGLSRSTGEDLLVDWHKVCRTTSGPRGRPGVAPGLLTLALLLSAAPLLAAPDSVPKAAPAEAFLSSGRSLSPDDLNRQIGQTLREPRYAWRSPLERAEPGGWFPRQLQRLTDTLSRWTRSAIDALGRFGEWLRRILRWEPPKPDAAPPASLSSDRLSRALAAALLVASAVLLFQLWRARRRPSGPAPAAAAAPLPAAPDVADETVTAEALPDDEWLRLARQLRTEREYRKAVRALFLGLLACLSRRDLLSLRTSKTNSDYLRELRRRTAGHAFDEAPFRHAAHLYEAGWYGDHPVTEETLDAMTANVEGYRHG